MGAEHINTRMAIMSLTTYRFECRGITPLLMHADDIEAADRVSAWIEKPENKSKAGDDRSPAWKWKTYLYFDDTHLVIPAEIMMAALRDAGMKIMIGRKSLKAATQTGIVIADPFMTLDVFISSLGDHPIRFSTRHNVSSQFSLASGVTGVCLLV